MKKTVKRKGMHLTLDGYGGNKEQLGNQDAVHQFLDICPSQIQAAPVMDPYTFKYHGKNPENSGVSGFSLLAEPGVHISVHTFPERSYLSLDIYFLEDFDYQQAIIYATEIFGISRYEHNLLDRGLEFPKDIKLAGDILKDERGRMKSGGPNLKKDPVPRKGGLWPGTNP